MHLFIGTGLVTSSSSYLLRDLGRVYAPYILNSRTRAEAGAFQINLLYYILLSFYNRAAQHFLHLFLLSRYADFNGPKYPTHHCHILLPSLLSMQTQNDDLVKHMLRHL